MTASLQRRANTGQPTVGLPRPSEVYYIGRDASVQFAARPFNFRVGRVRPIDEYSMWLWLDGYELNSAGEAVLRRSIFVMHPGLRPPAVIPQQRRRTKAAVGGQ